MKNMGYDPDATAVSTRIGSMIQRTYEKMCNDNNDTTSAYMNKHVRAGATQPIKNIHVPHVYKDNEVDASTLEVFKGYNLDLRTMTPADENKLRSHALLADDERKLPLYQLAALAKVKMLDEAARLKDSQGPRPEVCSYPNPASYNVNPNESTAQRMERVTSLPAYVHVPKAAVVHHSFTVDANPASSPFAQYSSKPSYLVDPKVTAALQSMAPQPQPQPEKKGFLSRVGNGIANAASKLKFWGKK